ncbi:MAG: Spx/MgsR family RNA polymerase-binding regulatory protein [Ahrensia sp.]|nr:Spx/MgsR family RNA polymerase-binding regulatory protein [Ahrensia sp.]
MKVYTLKSCDSCKKALKWLAEQGIAHEAHDVRADGLMESAVRHIVDTAGWEEAVNRRSTTWRGLSDADRADIDDDKAIALITANPTLLKRPVFVTEHEVMVGFNDAIKDWLAA